MLKVMTHEGIYLGFIRLLVPQLVAACLLVVGSRPEAVAGPDQLSANSTAPVIGDFDDLVMFASRTKSGTPPSTVKLGDYELQLFKRKALVNLPEHATIEQYHEFAVLHGSPIGQAHILLIDSRIEIKFTKASAGLNEGPDLILQTWSGGAHCCYSAYVFRLADPLGMQELDLRDSELAVLPGPDGRPPTLIYHDFTFAYWNASFAESPAPEIHLRWDRGAYVPDPVRMRKPKWSRRELNDARDTISAALANWNGAYTGCSDCDCFISDRRRDERPPVTLWAMLLERIYSGNTSDAVALYDRGWPAGLPGKREFWADFTLTLRAGWTWKRFKLEDLLEADQLFSYVPT